MILTNRGRGKKMGVGDPTTPPRSQPDFLKMPLIPVLDVSISNRGNEGGLKEINDGIKDA